MEIYLEKICADDRIYSLHAPLKLCWSAIGHFYFFENVPLMISGYAETSKGAVEAFGEAFDHQYQTLVLGDAASLSEGVRVVVEALRRLVLGVDMRPKHLITAPMRAMLAVLVEFCQQNFDGYVPHGIGERRTIKALERRGLVRCIGMVVCSGECDTKSHRAEQVEGLAYEITYAGQTLKLSKEALAARAPRTPEELMGVLQDCIHPTSGHLLSAKPIVTIRQRYKEESANPTNSDLVTRIDSR